ncbi:MAG: C40 family peptidase [Verrucomicrobia bacterium]|nr:C40 family peptidase [Verrucomicrobiota bacterium]
MNKKFVWLLLLGCLCFTGCATSRSEKRDNAPELESAVTTTFQAVAAKHAPDPRLAIFRIQPERTGDFLILRGEVESAAAKQELIESLKSQGIKAVDRITVLPAADLGEATWGIVRISVANVRDEKGHGAELGTQVLMGHVVRVWKKEGGWYYVQSSDRYLGWTGDDSFVRVTKEQVNEWNATPRVIVTDYEDRVWQQPGGKRRGNLPVSDVVAGALLKKVGEEGDWLKVELPDGRAGYLAKQSTMDFEAWRDSRQATGANIEESAKSLLGVPYLWGGTSTKGVDCSGFTKTVFYMNGVQLLRNASHQARQGMDIALDPEFRNLQKGDLLFFGSRASRGKPERITHVGIYLDNKQFIHSSGLVKLNSFDPKSPIYKESRLKSLVRARRYLPEE